ncbi:MAG: hypothetical protein WDO24_20190 [Pseudomonadota bacterium]
MQTRNVPDTGPRYWTAISLASIFGANMGDFVARELHLGHARGLPVLALVFALILLAERRSKTPTEAYYWLAIVTLRTAATNLADLATHDFKLDYPWVIAGLAALLVGVLVLESRIRRDAATAPASGLPTTTGFYWTAMLIAGTLGTAAGDYIADDLGLGLVWGSVLLGGLLAVMLALRSLPGLATKPSYWGTIVMVRAAGTTVGDFLASSRRGLGLGLYVSTPCTGLLLVAVLLLWRKQPRPQMVEA